MIHVARKRFGQHFLVDRAIIDAIVNAINPREGERVVEIGPGLAALTDALLARIKSLTAIEIDRDLAQRLRNRYRDRIELVQADVLTVDFRRLAEGGRLRVVGNLPYNISSPLLVHLLEARDRIVDQHFMLQKEVVERIVAGPGSTAYGRLGVLMQAYYEVELLFDVPPESFDPPPRVDSAVLRMLPLRDPAPVEPTLLSEVVAAAFGQRRKMLRNTLLPWLTQQGVDAPELAPTERPEGVPVASYVELAVRLARKRGASA